ncbi:hypothetical protein [Caulobacter sp. NIBR1757]|uniref:hypothetical protein n=1 Tax=Caulobacter sp. NIBR1757 TaxID=3016000 RepID=UPI0022F14021|nr:hypothetical protein [Caulobacter sp. NIBR1757]WGM37426.1 hypothetical protein AMEJIAPC_00324 [Caulobacter sp. NIBR1757]
MHLIGRLLSLALLLPALPAMAQTGTASPGFNYFHRAGATLEVHEADIRFCEGEARKTVAQYVEAGHYDKPRPGLFNTALLNAVQLQFDRNQVQANIETCMLIRGWSVVRPPAADEQSLLGAHQASLVSYLSARVGAATPQGAEIRRYDPTLAIVYTMPGYASKPQESLSYRAVFGTEPPVFALPKAAEWPEEWQFLNRVKAPAALGPATTLLIVRTHGTRPGQQINLRFMRIEERASDSPALQVFQASSPTKMFWKAGTPMQDIYVFEVPPGRWLLLGDTISTFCLGAPGFEVKAGEAVFAGTFSSEVVGDLQPKMAVEPAAAALPPALAGRLRAAEWRNGYAFDCGSPPATLLRAFEVTGATSK